MSDTLRVDALFSKHAAESVEFHHAGLSRDDRYLAIGHHRELASLAFKLERELTFANEEISRLRAELATAQKDAARYWWLKSTDTAVCSYLDDDGIHWSLTGRDGNNVTTANLDNVIDANIAAEKKP